MPSVDLICLANSHKYGHRCIAGLRTDGSGWIRPVSSREHGELAPLQYNLPNHTEPSVLDIVRVGVSKPQPILNQPEDWLIDTSPWQLISRPAPASSSEILRAALQRGRLIFGDDSRSISMTQIQERGGVPSSLTLVRPERVWWQTSTYQEWKKARVLFQLEKSSYDLPLTDPEFVKRVKRLEVGYHQDHEVQIETGTRYFFAISLSEPFGDGICYKLVAGVINIPPAWEV